MEIQSPEIEGDHVGQSRERGELPDSLVDERILESAGPGPEGPLSLF